MIIVFIAVFYLFMVIVIARLFMRREQGLGTVFVFGMSAFIYYVAIPVESVLTGQSLLYREGHLFMFREEWIVKAAAMGLLALVGFSSGLYASGFRMRLEDWNCPLQKRANLSEAKGGNGVWIILLTTITIIAVYFRRLLTDLSSYQGNYTTLYLNPVFSYLLKISVLCLAIISAYYIFLAKKPIIPVLGIGAVMLWGLYSSNKDPILVGLVTLSAYFYRWHLSSRPYTAVVGVLVVIALAAVGPLLFSLFRAGVGFSFYSVLRGGLFLRSDPAGPFYTLMSTFESAPPIQYGLSYIKALMNWIPRFLWPSKPLSMSEAFALAHIVNWQPGRGLGFSLLAESYINFRFLGPLIQYSLIGFVWGTGWRLLRQYKTIGDTTFKSIYVVVGFYLLILMHRGDTTLIVTQVVQSLVPIVLVVVVIGKLRWRVS